MFIEQQTVDGDIKLMVWLAKSAKTSDALYRIKLLIALRDKNGICTIKEKKTGTVSFCLLIT